MRLEIREWEAARAQAESPWSASRLCLSELRLRLEVAMFLRSPTADTSHGVDLVLVSAVRRARGSRD